MSSERTRGLGKGLSALLGDGPGDEPRARPARGEKAQDAAAPRGPLVVPIEMIQPNPDQPRRIFDPEEIAALADSIRQKGIIQPILVRPLDAGAYQIVAGERRWRAAQKAGLHEAPVVVRAMGDEETLEIAIIENVQRQDLTPLEEAQAYRALSDDFGKTQAQIAEMIGKSRVHVANTMRLLDLPQGVRELLEAGKLTAGHARAIGGSTHAEALAQIIVRRNLSVRQAEALARKGLDEENAAPRAKTPAAPKDADTAALEADLEAALGLSVSLQDSGAGKGELRLKYETLEQLDDLCRRLTGG